MSSTTQKHIYMVLGPPRSGTSVMARALNALGVALGDELMPANAINPKGFYEDYDVVFGINERVLQILDLRWDHVQYLTPAQFNTAALDDVHAWAQHLLQKRFLRTEAWCFKDPRTAKLLPFWQKQCAAQRLNEHYVIALRHPLSVATSYQKISGHDIEQGLLLWLSTLMAACDYTQGKSRVFVSYETMMQHPVATLQRMHQQLQLTTPLHASSVDVFSETFVDQRLQHYTHSLQALAQHPAVPVAPLCLELYAWLNAIAHDEQAFDAMQWQVLRDKFMLHAPLYVYIDRLLKQQQQQADALHDLYKSRLWRWIYPLRYLDNALRARRKHQKAQRLTARFMS